MGYFDGSKLKLWSLAQRYTLADRFSVRLRRLLPQPHVADLRLHARVPERAQVHRRPARARHGHKKGEEAEVTQDGYAVNTMQGPLLFDPTKKQTFLPPQTCPPSATG